MHCTLHYTSRDTFPVQLVVPLALHCALQLVGSLGGMPSQPLASVHLQRSSLASLQHTLRVACQSASAGVLAELLKGLLAVMSFLHTAEDDAVHAASWVGG